MRARLLLAMLSALSAVLLSVSVPPAAGVPTAPPPGLCDRLQQTPAQVPMCTHGPDPVSAFGSPGEVGAPPPSAPAPALAALCVDGGVTGKRVEVLYGVPQDRANRYSAQLTTMRNVLAQANSNLDAADAATTQGYRWLCENGTDITIRNVTLVPVGSDFSFTFDDYLNSVQNQVGLGLGPVNYTASNRIYFTFVDQVTDSYPYGGQGGIWNDDRSDPTVNQNNDAGAKYSMTAYYDASIVGHEIGHNIGAVQLSAPHTSGGWHCHDEYDLMCYSDGGSYFQNGGQLTFPCNSTSQDLIMDCGRDDYYYPGTPPSTNYLATHWNTARSGFLTPLGDTSRPVVSARKPAANATAVAVGANVTATFNEAVQGVSGSSFQLKNAAGTVVAAAVSYDAATSVATLNPNSNLAADTRYTATLTGGATAIRDTAGNTLETTSWTFLSGPRPTLSSKTPAGGATGVSRTANTTATFSEAVVGVSGSTFQLRNPSGTMITAVISYNATSRVATLNPSATLAAGTKYTATLTGGTSAIRDAAGNPLKTVSWSFTTGAT